MKRKGNKEEAQVGTTTKKVKKSVSFSKEVGISKSPEIIDEGAKTRKKEKRGKFEKATENKKSDKTTKVNFVPKTDKPKNVVKKDKNGGKKSMTIVDGEKSNGFDKKSEKKSFEGKHDKSKNFGSKGGKGDKKWDTPTADGEKPDWLEFKKEKKKLKETRRAKRLATAYDASVKAKSVGEQLRRADCSAEDRVKFTKQLYELLKGNLNKAILTHDMSRVVQWLIKYCDSEIRQLVLTELKPSFAQMLQSKYAKNCLKKALKHGSDEIRSEIVKSCYGNVVKLVSHSVSSELVDDVYKTYASDLDKVRFKQEFYGDMYKQAKDDSIAKISDVFASAPDMKSATLSAVKINVVRVLNKELVSSSIVQAVLVDYLEICTPEDRSEMIVMLRNSIVQLSKSENGAKIAMICIWHGTNKDRKISLKAVKEQVKDIANSEHGHKILLAMFDSIDDTVLMKKLILAEIMNDLVEIASNEYGRRVILYLVGRRDSHYFHPALVDHLKQGDGNATSKKEAEIREKELVEAVIGTFLKAIAEDTISWLANSSIAIVTLAILKKGHGDNLKLAFESIAKFITNLESKLKEEDGIERWAVEHSGLHSMLKKLIQTEKTFEEKECAPFGKILEEILDTKIIERLIDINRGCFLLILILENSSESVVKSLLSKIKPLTKLIRSKKGSGASILLKKIK